MRQKIEEFLHHLIAVNFREDGRGRNGQTAAIAMNQAALGQVHRGERNRVNQQHIGLAIAASKTGELTVLNRVNVFVGKFFRRKVCDPRALLVRRHILADRVK
jgi:hypothetical protein